MATLALATAPRLHQDAARSRGLRRGRRSAPCPPVAPTALPAAPTAVELLGLLTRVRSARVAVGELDATRLYDLRAFKASWAELGYLHRLAGGGRHGGTVVTSMRQLVSGIAGLHPSWKLTGDPWQDRDRHHQSLRRRLSALSAAGLVQWRVGVDEDLQERRTELQLLPVPELLADELTAAAARLQRWETRYGEDLDTSSQTGISNVKRAAAPLSACERRRRGRQRAVQAAQSRRDARASQTNSSPPFGAPPTSENNNDVEISADAHNTTNAYGDRTGVTRTSAPKTAIPDPDIAPVLGSSARAAVGVYDQAPRVGGPAAGELFEFDVEALVARVRRREAERAGVLGEIAGQCERRAREVAQWGPERAWPAGRLREAWVVARSGAAAAADHGPTAAGVLLAEDHQRLRRAVARWQAHASAAPASYPAGGLAALLYLALLAGQQGGARTLRQGIGALDQLSRRLRAQATVDSPQRLNGATTRAKRRREPSQSTRLAFRAARWPPWVATDAAGEPVLVDGVLQVDEHLMLALGSDTYRQVLRDAYLLAGRWPPAELDGRTQMTLRHRGLLEPAVRRTPSVDYDLVELARRSGAQIAWLERLSPAWRAQELDELRRRDAAHTRQETARFASYLTDLGCHRGDPDG